MEAKMPRVTTGGRWPRVMLGLAGLALGAAVVLAAPNPATAGANPLADLSPTPAARGVSTPCLDCHGDPDLATTLPNGERLSLFVDEEEVSASVHRGKLACTDCHRLITSLPHRKPLVGSRREYSVAQYEACKRCHFANYTRTLDSIHYQAMSGGNQGAPLCTDCHGYHRVARPGQPRSAISRGCATCHTEAYSAYAGSVHGRALIEEGNRDVPGCTDCHGTHTIRGADTASFRLDSPNMCARCHADETLMRKYGLSPNVFKTYVQDFHGATVALARRQGDDRGTEKAVCCDCHGVHDVRSIRGSDPGEIRQKVGATCQKCHPDASTSFPDAWLSHYELSMDRAPLAYLVRAAYTVVLPLVVGGLMLHILVDLWRIARNR